MFLDGQFSTYPSQQATRPGFTHDDVGRSLPWDAHEAGSWLSDVTTEQVQSDGARARIHRVLALVRQDLAEKELEIQALHPGDQRALGEVVPRLRLRLRRALSRIDWLVGRLASLDAWDAEHLLRTLAGDLGELLDREAELYLSIEMAARTADAR